MLLVLDCRRPVHMRVFKLLFTDRWPMRSLSVLSEQTLDGLE